LFHPFGIGESETGLTARILEETWQAHIPRFTFIYSSGLNKSSEISQNNKPKMAFQSRRRRVELVETDVMILTTQPKPD
jgi:hypothetical protein